MAIGEDQYEIDYRSPSMVIGYHGDHGDDRGPKRIQVRFK